MDILTAPSISSCRGPTDVKTSELWPENDAYSQPPHECGPGIRPKDATDKEAHAPRSRGRSVVVLYNGVRTHRSLNKDAPVSRSVQRTGVITSNPILGGLHRHYVRV